MILDSSVAVEVALGTETGRRVIPQLADELYVPELFFAEIHSVLNKLKVRKLIDSQAAHAARKTLNSLGLCPLPVHHLEDELWKLSQGMSAYDAHYVVLAKASKMPLATCDRRLANANVSGVKFLVV